MCLATVYTDNREDICGARYPVLSIMTPKCLSLHLHGEQPTPLQFLVSSLTQRTARGLDSRHPVRITLRPRLILCKSCKTGLPPLITVPSSCRLPALCSPVTVTPDEPVGLVLPGFPASWFPAFQCSQRSVLCASCLHYGN